MKILSPCDLEDAIAGSALIGSELGVSDWVEVTQENVDVFADTTIDHQYIHVDQEAAAQTPFGGTIAHGFLSLSMLSHFAENGCGVGVENAKMGLNYGFDKIRFLQPVRVGSRIRGRGVLMSVDEKNPGQYLFKLNITVEIEDVDKPALVAEWLVMLFN